MNQTILKNGDRNSTLEMAFPSSANVSDALGQLGYKFQTMHSRVRPITGLSMWGPAYTVQCYPGATYALEEALEKAAPGDVLVVGGEAFTEAVLMGGLMSTRAKQRGMAGAVIDGAVRDVAELRRVNWPMFASGVTPRAGTFAQIGQWEVAVACGGVVVQPGDMVAADEDGIVVVPAAILDEALERAWEIERKENFIAKAVQEGLSLAEAVREYKAQTE